jgi:hypothetical protein
VQPSAERVAAAPRLQRAHERVEVAVVLASEAFARECACARYELPDEPRNLAGVVDED